MLGLTTSFLTYPRLPQHVDFTGLDLKSNEGLKRAVEEMIYVEGFTLKLDISFQWVLLKEDVVGFYETMGARDYHQIIQSAGIDCVGNFYICKAAQVIRDVGGRYKLVDYYENRRGIADVMFEELSKRLREEHVTVLYLQFQYVYLPEDYEKEIEEKLVREQQTIIAGLEQQLATVRSGMRL